MVLMTPTASVNRSEFLALVRSSGLVSSKALDRVARGLSHAATSGDEVSRVLVDAGLLTEFQASRLLAGKTDGLVVGQYHILNQIGKSSVGRVYRARHQTMNRLVAIKVLAAEQTRDPARREAFRDEARSAAQLAHPNVVTVLDVNQLGDRLYLVLEYVDGVSLDRLVREGGPLSVARACDFVRQALLGLAHAHQKRMAHGAITPTTLLVGRPGGKGRADRPEVKVANFGLGRVADTMDDDDPSDYLAPELANASTRATPAADLYGIGGTLFYLLTGRAPFEGSSSPDIAQLRRDVPAPVANLIRAMLSRAPEYRPADAEQVAAALAPFAAGHDSGQIEFAVLQSSGPASANGTFLSGMLNPPEADLTDTSPWSELDGQTLDEDAGLTPIATSGNDQRWGERTFRATLGYAAMILTMFAAAGTAAGFLIGWITSK